MQLDLENDLSVYRVFEDKLALKFRDKHSNDDVLLNRIDKKYLRLSVNPYFEADSSFRSKKCPGCLKTKVGAYRIIYHINESNKTIQILDVGPRGSIYKKWK